MWQRQKNEIRQRVGKYRTFGSFLWTRDVKSDKLSVTTVFRNHPHVKRYCRHSDQYALDYWPLNRFSRLSPCLGNTCRLFQIIFQRLDRHEAAQFASRDRPFVPRFQHRRIVQFHRACCSPRTRHSECSAQQKLLIFPQVFSLTQCKLSCKHHKAKYYVYDQISNNCVCRKKIKHQIRNRFTCGVVKVWWPRDNKRWLLCQVKRLFDLYV